MTAPTILASTDVYPASPEGANHPGACVLTDDTVLIAWEAAGTLTLTHYTRDLSLLGQTTTTPGSTDVRGVALFARPDGTATLTHAGQTWHVTINPLTLTPGPAAPTTIQYGSGYSSMLTLGDTTLLTADTEIIAHRDGTITRHPIAGGAEFTTALHPTGDGRAWVSTSAWPTTTLHTLDPTTGASSAVETTTQHEDEFAGVHVGPGRYAQLNLDSTLTLRDAAGALLTSAPWPGQTPGSTWQGTAVGSVTLDDGTVLAALHWDDTTTRHGGTGLARITRDTITATDLHPPTLGLQGAGGSQSPVVARGARTAVIVHHNVLDATWTGAPESLYAVTAWTVDLGGRHAQLRVGLVQGDGHPWSSRLVGDESWEHGPGRMKIGTPASPSGWAMEVKPGDDTTGATWVRLDLPDGRAAAFRVIPWPGR